MHFKRILVLAHTAQGGVMDITLVFSDNTAHTFANTEYFRLGRCVDHVPMVDLKIISGSQIRWRHVKQVEATDIDSGLRFVIFRFE